MFARYFVEVGVGSLEAGLRRRVSIRLGEPVRFPSMTSVPLTWEPVGLEGLLMGPHEPSMGGYGGATSR